LIPKKAYFLSTLAGVLTTPMFTKSTFIILGFPAWAFYTLIMTILYSFIVAIILHVYWPTKKTTE